MTQLDPPRRHARDLATLLSDLAVLYEQLLSLTRAKIDAMRSADADTLGELTQKEHALIERVSQREGLRRQLMDRLGASMDMPPRGGRTLTCSQLAARFKDAQGLRLQEAAARLRHTMSNLAAANRLAAALARGVLGHFKAIFATIAADGEAPLLYSRQGAPLRGGRTQILEITG